MSSLPWMEERKMELPSWLRSLRWMRSFGVGKCLGMGRVVVVVEEEEEEEGASWGREMAGISCWKYGDITGMSGRSGGSTYYAVAGRLQLFGVRREFRQHQRLDIFADRKSAEVCVDSLFSPYLGLSKLRTNVPTTSPV